MPVQNLKIGQKLMLSFGSVIALLLLLAVVAWVQLQTLRADIELMNRDRYPKTALAHAVKDQLNETARGMRNILLIGDADAARNEYADIAKNSVAITASLSQLDKSITTEQGRSLLNALTEQRQRFLGQRDAFLALAKSGKRDEAQRLLLQQVQPAQGDYLGALDKLIAYQSTLMDEAGQVSANETERAGALIIGIALAATVISFALALLTARGVLRQLGGEPERAVEIAGKIAAGDLAVPIDLMPHDRGSLLFALLSMRDSLAGMVGQVRAGTAAIATASGQIAAGNADLSARTEAQASSLEQTASSMEQLTSTVQHNADNARQASQLAASASDIAVRGGAVVRQVVDTMGAINDSAKKIVDIIGVIDGIAFQTNILALNAAVEAARAGEQGRGFAVVATEVRNLAQRSAGAAKEIKELIGDSVQKVDSGSRLVDQAGATMQEIVDSVRRVTDVMSEIMAAGQEQSEGIAQINQAVLQMDQVTQQNAAQVEQAAAATEALRDEASDLTRIVGVFQLGALAAVSRPARPAARPAARAAAHAPAPRAALRVGGKPAGAKAQPEDEWSTF